MLCTYNMQFILFDEHIVKAIYQIYNLFFNDMTI